MIDGIWLKILLWAWAILLGAFAAMTGRDYFVAPILRIVDKCKEMRWPAILFNVAFCTMFISAAIEAGATKTNGVMSLPPQTMTMQHPALEQMQAPVGDRPQMLTSGGLLEQTVSDEEIALGYICVLETNDVAYSYAMPPNAQIIGNWHMRGTFGEWMPVSLGWSFPLGTNSYSMFSVFNNGMIRPRPRDVEHQITAVAVPMLFTQGLSKFWILDCMDGSKLLSWDNAFLNGDTNTPVNAQIMLCQNGNFSTRSNEQLRVYRRVNPADWDGDGLANVIDAAPKASDGYCFGTGVDWLNANCGGVLSASVDTNGEIVISWNYGVNPDAYYWLTFTSLADNNLISIICDGPSNLGDLTVIANSNQVCQVPLLIGPEYEIDAQGDLDAGSATHEDAEIEIANARSFTVTVPVELSMVQSPANLAELNLVSNYQGLNPQLVSTEGGCCTNEISNCCLWWNCSENCNCGGGEECFSAVAAWEGYAMPFYWFGYCPCRREGDDDVVSAAGGVALSIPDTIFENNDHDFETDVLYTDFGTPKSCDDDVALCWLDASSTGVATYRGTTGFVGEVMTPDAPLDEDLYLVSAGTAIPMGSGVATRYSFYLNADNYSRRYRAARIGFDWTDANGVVAPLHARFTVARPIVEPICTETTNVVENGIEHEYTLNPCAVGIGKDAYFRIRVLPDDYPDENIVWTSDSEGKVSFVGGNTGRAVTVRGLGTGLTNLSIQIGDSSSNPPMFPLHVVTNRVLHMTAWVIADESGANASAETGIMDMTCQMNDIYAQIATSWIVDSINVVTNSHFTEVSDELNSEDDEIPTINDLKAVYAGSSMTDVYFVKRILNNSSTRAFHYNHGIVMTRGNDAIVLAHEFGHELGAEDMYISGSSDLYSVINVPFDYSRAEGDWNNGSVGGGAGYYTRGVTCDAVINRLLMNGRGVVGRDISRGAIYGVKKTAGDIYEKGTVSIGLLPQ